MRKKLVIRKQIHAFSRDTLTIRIAAALYLVMQHARLHVLHKIIHICRECQPQPDRFYCKSKSAVIVRKRFLHNRETVTLLMQCDLGQTLTLLDHTVIIVLHAIMQAYTAQILAVIERITTKRIDRCRKFHTEEVLPPRESAFPDASHRKIFYDCRDG